MARQPRRARHRSWMRDVAVIERRRLDLVSTACSFGRFDSLKPRADHHRRRAGARTGADVKEAERDRHLGWIDPDTGDLLRACRRPLAADHADLRCDRVRARDGAGHPACWSRSGASKLRDSRARARCSSRVAACAVCRTDLHVVDGDLTHPEAADHSRSRDRRPRRSRLGTGVSSSPGRARRRAVAGLDLRRLRLLPARRGKPVSEGAFHRLSDRRRLRRVRRRRRPLLLSSAWRVWRRRGRAVAVRRARSARAPGQGRRRRAAPACRALAPRRTSAQVARPGARVFAFTRPGDMAAQGFARRLGAVWAGGSDEAPPDRWTRRCCSRRWRTCWPAAWQGPVRPGGTVVCAGIDVQRHPVVPLPRPVAERRIVGDLTRQDGLDFLRVAAELRARAAATPIRSAQASQALDDLRAGRPSPARPCSWSTSPGALLSRRTYGGRRACAHSIAARAGGSSIDGSWSRSATHACEQLSSTKLRARRSAAASTRWPRPRR